MANLLPSIQQVAYLDKTLYFYYQRENSAQHTWNISSQQYNQEIGQLLVTICQQCHFYKALPYAQGVLLLSTALYGVHLLLRDKNNQFSSQLQEVVSLFQKNRKFIFHNRIIWQPAKFCIQVWVLFPTFTKWYCRLPGINILLQTWVSRKINAPR